MTMVLSLSNLHATRHGPTAAFMLAIASLSLAACGGAAPAQPARPATPSLTPEAIPGHFRHRSSRIVAAQRANHRGRDVLVAAGAPVVIEAKLAYGVTDKDLHDEDVLVEREVPGGPRGWERLGVARTSLEGQGDDGGRIHFAVPESTTFAMGSHRVRVTVLGDGTSAELSVVVVPEGQPIFVSDVDGTLTESELADVPAFVLRKQPPAHPGASRALRALASRGLVPVYITARPEWMVARTREFLAMNQFPPGVVVTRRDKSGGYGASAAAYKREELARLARVARIEWAFGNMPSDADAYSMFVADRAHRVFYRHTDAAHGGRRIESYEDFASELD
jgi:hypothetical protein